MQIFVHVGVHKTATTFFQKDVFPFISDCVFLPRENCIKFSEYLIYNNEFEIIKALSLWEEALGTMVDDIHENSKILISDEGYYLHPYQGENNFRSILRLISFFGDDLNIFLLLRRQGDLLSSLYLQFIKTGGVANFHKFLGSNGNGIINFEYFLFDKLIDLLLANISVSKFKIFLYEEFLTNKSAILNEIVLFLSNGLPNTKSIQYQDRVSNASLHSFFVPFVRVLNSFTKSYKNPEKLLPFLFFRLYMNFFLRFSRFLRPGNRAKYRFRCEQEILISISNWKLIQLLPELPLKEYNYAIKNEKIS